MDVQRIKVLLIQKSQSGNSFLSDLLARRGCECRFATSDTEVRALVVSPGFDLVLGPINLNGGSLYPVMGLLKGSRTTMFYSLAVEDGSWWLPAVWLGTNCFGAPAFHHRKFVNVLDETVEAIRSVIAARAEEPRVAGPLSDTPLEFPFPRNMPLPAAPGRAKIVNIAPRKALR